MLRSIDLLKSEINKFFYIYRSAQ